MMRLASSDLGQVARGLDGRAVLHELAGPPGDLCSQHEEGPVWREQGQGGRTGKVFEEQKQWPILC